MTLKLKKYIYDIITPPNAVKFVNPGQVQCKSFPCEVLTCACIHKNWLVWLRQFWLTVHDHDHDNYNIHVAAIDCCIEMEWDPH